MFLSLKDCTSDLFEARGVLEELEDRHTIRTKTAADYWERIAAEYRTSLRAMLAMHLTPLIEPDVAIPELSSNRYSCGYSISTYGEKVRISKAASASTSHWSTSDLNAEYPKAGVHKSRESWAQNPMRLYSTVELAMKAGRSQLAWRFANVLAEIDKQIEESSQKWKQSDSATLQSGKTNDAS
jgi:hypothetical protein